MLQTASDSRPPWNTMPWSWGLKIMAMIRSFQRFILFLYFNFSLAFRNMYFFYQLLFPISVSLNRIWIIELVGSNTVSPLIYLLVRVLDSHISDMAFDDCATPLLWNSVGFMIPGHVWYHHPVACGSNMRIDDHALIVGFYTFHGNETFKCGVSLCALTVKLSAVHISFMQYKN